MTKTENLEAPICYLCEIAPATATKIEAELVLAEDADEADTFIVTRNAICDGCEDAHFDGTEDYPGLLPLSELAG